MGSRRCRRAPVALYDWGAEEQYERVFPYSRSRGCQEATMSRYELCLQSTWESDKGRIESSEKDY